MNGTVKVFVANFWMKKRSAGLEPNLAPGFGPVLHLPEMAQIHNPRHIKALIAACRSMGVELLPGCAALGFQLQGERIEGVRTSVGVMRADKFVLTTGAWTDPLLEPLGWKSGIHPVRGQIALLQPGKSLLRRVVAHGARYLVPRPDGRVLVGSTEENVGFDRRTTTTAIHDLLELAMSLVPDLGYAAFERSWAGLRPGSPDGLPFLGWVPGIANLCVAAGHFRSGIQLSTGTGLLLRDLVLDRPTPLSLEPFRLGTRS